MIDICNKVSRRRNEYRITRKLVDNEILRATKASSAMTGDETQMVIYILVAEHVPLLMFKTFICLEFRG
jgi:hypothetical protein